MAAPAPPNHMLQDSNLAADFQQKIQFTSNDKKFIYKRYRLIRFQLKNCFKKFMPSLTTN